MTETRAPQTFEFVALATFMASTSAVPAPEATFPTTTRRPTRPEPPGQLAVNVLKIDAILGRSYDATSGVEDQVCR